MSLQAPGSRLRILVVDDDRPIRRFLCTALSLEYTLLEASTGQEALGAVLSGRPDVILLDLGLPDLEGVEVVRLLREWSHIPIIIISVRDQEEQKVAALDAGADDYLTKPFRVGELNARVRAALRRSVTPDAEPVFQQDDLQVDLAHRKVCSQGKPVLLTPTEYDILRVLVQHAGMVLTHPQMIRSIWGGEAADQEQNAHRLRVNVSNLRRKLEPDPARPHYIVTEPGVGYRLKTA